MHKLWQFQKVLRKEEKCEENKMNFKGTYQKRLDKFSSNFELEVPHPDGIYTEFFSVFLFSESWATDVWKQHFLLL